MPVNAWATIINGNSLGVIEEQSFIKFLNGKGYRGDLCKCLPFIRLEKYYEEWRKG